MSVTYPRLLPLGDTAWTVEFGAAISAQANGKVMHLRQSLMNLRDDVPELAAIIDVVPTFRSLTVHYDPLGVGAEGLRDCLQTLAEAALPLAVTGRLWQLPACFDEGFSPDLAELATRHGLSVELVVERLCMTTFQVQMIGFMPGFPYMTGLPHDLATPRLVTPRKAVPARSIAVAGEMCAIYPWESPGGWHLLGNTPVDLFSLDEVQPALLAPGDRVCWQRIDADSHRSISACLARGEWHRSRFLKAEGEA